jgi:hypothetical protein
VAVRRGLVHRLRDVRRPRLLGLHHAHVLHQPGPLPRHQKPAEDAPQHHHPHHSDADSAGVAAVHAGLEQHHRLRYAAPARLLFPFQSIFSCRDYRRQEHHAGARLVRHQQPRLLRLRLAGDVLRADGDHGGDVRPHRPAPPQEGPLRRRAPRERPVPPAGRPLRPEGEDDAGDVEDGRLGGEVGSYDYFHPG